MRINKLLSNLGVCSRKDAARLIDEGRVKVNGKLSIPGQWVEESDHILIDDKEIEIKEKVYIALNKPKGITCTAASEVKDNIIDYINYPEYIFPVGRLDKPSQGLILMTNDGELANKIIAADNEHEKEYIVTLNKDFEDTFITGMENGVEIDGVVTKKCKAKRINDNTFNIILTQGLNKQIRKMSKAFGYEVKKLERIRIMNIKLDGIEYGKWRYLSSEEEIELKTSSFFSNNNYSEITYNTVYKGNT